MRKPRVRFTLRRMMALIFYVAVDSAAFYNATWHGSSGWLLGFLFLTVLGPVILGMGWLLRRMDWSGRILV